MARPSSSRIGHSISTGGTARKRGPGKSPLPPRPACAIASSTARWARRCDSPADVNGSTGMKSIVPAIVVLRPSIGKRVSVWMPDSPAVSFAQLSDLPAPSEVITPMPVTTTTGLPNLSRGALMLFPTREAHGDRALVRPLEDVLTDGFDQGHPFAPPMTGSHHHNLGRRSLHFNLDPGGIAGRKQRAARNRKRRNAQSEDALGVDGMPESRSGRPHEEAGMFAEEGPLFGGRGFGAGRTRENGAAVLELAEGRPQFPQRS